MIALIYLLFFSATHTLACDNTTCSICNNTCLECQDGYGFNSSGECQLCEEENCLECSANNSQCSECLDRYGVNSSFSCEVCSIDFCLNCNRRNVLECVSCSELYGLNETKKCVACESEYCENCSSNFRVCEVCKSGFGFKSNNECVTCKEDFCNECFHNYEVCTKCSIKSSLQNGTCIACLQNCYNCSINPYNCTTCNQRYYINSSDTCRKCNDNNCERCRENLTTCYNCLNNYGVSTTDSCELCLIWNCKRCNQNSSRCTECENNFGLSSFLNSTFKFGLVCEACNSKVDNCEECDTTNSSHCTKCFDEYWLDHNQCKNCNVPNCVSCYNWYNQCHTCHQFYGKTLTHQCESCNSSNSKCLECDATNITICTVCEAEFFVNENDYCEPCQIPCKTCQARDECLSCSNSSHYLDPNNHTCNPCPVECTKCVYYYPSNPSCTSCVNITFTLSLIYPQKCVDVCGDFITITLLCDNEMGVDYDGCDRECKIEKDFKCEVSNQTTFCTYTKELNLRIESILKKEFENQFELTLNVWPPLHVFWDPQGKSTKNLYSGLFDFKDSKISVHSAKYLKETHQFLLILELKESMIDETFTLHFLPSKELDDRYRDTPSSSVNIHFAKVYYHSELVYKCTRFVPPLCYLTIVLSFISCPLGIVAKSLAGMENLVLNQLFWLMFVWLNSELFVPFTQIYPMKYITGFGIHLIATEDSMDQENEKLKTSNTQNESFSFPSTFSSTPYFQNFNIDTQLLVNSYNIEIIFQIIPLIAGFVFIFLVKKQEAITKLLRIEKQTGIANEKIETQITASKDKTNKLEFWSSLLLQTCLTFTIFNLLNFVSSTCIVFQFSNKITNVLNILFFVIYFLIFAATFILFFIEPFPFGFFRFTFKREFLAMNYLDIFCLSFVISIVLTCFQSKISWASVVSFGVLLLFAIIYRPYKELKENIRAILILLCILTVLCFRVYLQFSPEPANNSTFIYFFLLILLLNVIGIATVCYLIYMIVFTYYILPQRSKTDMSEVIEEIDAMEINEKIRKVILGEDSAFKKMLKGSNMSVMNFSNQLSHKVRDEELRVEEYNEKSSPSRLGFLQEDLESGRRLRKEMYQTEYSISHKLKDSESPIYSNNFYVKEEKFLNKNVEDYLLSKSHIDMSMDQNRPEGSEKEEIKVACALLISAEENKFLQVKNAEQHTNRLKAHGYKFDSSYMDAYTDIPE